MSEFCQVWVTCANGEEATQVASLLLQKKLIACAKQVNVGADFLWEGSVDHNDEVLLIMETRTELFDAITIEIEKIHSYDVPVIQAIPIIKLSNKAHKWLKANIHK